MSLIKCKECGKEISDQAVACPNCGCPVTKENINIQQPVNKKKKGHGCLTTIVIFCLIIIAISVSISKGVDSGAGQETETKSVIGKYIDDLSDESAQQIDSVLSNCGIENLKAVEHDEFLDNAHIEGETGYRMTNGNIDNIILYLDNEKNVYRINYAGYELYADGEVQATLQDYTVSIDDINKYQILCEEKVKQVLKSPSTAKFPNYTEWGWKKEKNVFTIQGYVDAQNSFGAELRSQFQFIVDTDSDTIQSFIFDGEELIK